MIPESIDINKLLFLDIETVPEVSDFFTLNKSKMLLWCNKIKKIIQDDNHISYTDDGNLMWETIQSNKDYFNNLYLKNAALYAEFGKIICISVGYKSDEAYVVRSYMNDSEENLLLTFSKDIGKSSRKICAHNGFNFDFPFIVKRCIYLGITLPKQFRLVDVKPWESMLIDSMQIMKFNSYNEGSNISLDLLCNLLNIESPKESMSGKELYKLYYSQEPDRFEKIAEYCNGDVRANIRCVEKIAKSF